MRRHLLGLFVPALLVAAAGQAPAAQAQRQFLVNTTEWVFPLETFHCVALDQPCHLSAAIELAQRAGGSGAVSACFDDDNPRCLHTDDPNYDPATGKWTIKIGSEFSGYSITGDGLDVDFTANIDGWSGPQDDRVIVEFEEPLGEAFIVQANDTHFAGFGIRGSFGSAAFVVRTVGAAEVTSQNVFGPGLILSEIAEGQAIRMRGSGVQDNRIVGNWCGLMGDGTLVAGLKDFCVVLSEGAHDNTIGGSDPGDRNYFAGNEGAAVQIGDPASRNNVVEGNNFGTDATGLRAAPNHTGVNVVRQAEGTKIYGNLISGNAFNGILLDNTSTEFGRIITRVEDNWIGVDKKGIKALANRGCGIEIRGLSKNIVVKNNRVWHNDLCGVIITGELARNNTITQNSITDNAGRAIGVALGANNGIEAPTVTQATTTEARGTACPGCTVELFSDPLDEAMNFEGETVAGTDGVWQLSKPTGFQLRILTATATNGENTSALSARKVISVIPTASPTGGTGVGTPTATASSPWQLVFLPWVANAYTRK